MKIAKIANFGTLIALIVIAIVQWKQIKVLDYRCDELYQLHGSQRQDIEYLKELTDILQTYAMNENTVKRIIEEQASGVSSSTDTTTDTGATTLEVIIRKDVYLVNGGLTAVDVDRLTELVLNAAMQGQTVTITCDGALVNEWEKLIQICSKANVKYVENGC